MCQVNLNSIQAQSTNGINASSIILSGTAASGCKTVKLEISACGITGFIVNVPVTNGSWSYQFLGDCFCGALVKLAATCCDAAGVPIPGCGPNEFQEQIVCPPTDCCLSAQIIPTIGDCNANNQRLVTFSVNVNVTPTQSSCLPYVLQVDFGDGNSSAAQVISAVGSHSFSATHNYVANASYTAHLSYVLPGGLTCPAIDVPLVIPTCTPNCCPEITDIAIEFGDCNANCERLVVLTSTVSPPVAACLPAYLEWQITDSNNNSITGAGFTSADPSPRSEQFWLSSTGSPYTATLLVHYPGGCTEMVRSFSVPECQSAPPCPEINNFSHVVEKCISQGDKCCRQVTFTYDINVQPGCGGGPKPKVRINFGDGTTYDVVFSSAGNYQSTWTHPYCQEGDYVVTMETLYPAACLDKTLIVHVPKCDPSECGQTPTDPTEDEGNGGKFCPCCIPLLILVTSYFFLWTQGYYQGDLSIFSVILGAKWGYASFLFTLLLWVLITFCYKVVKACRKCWQCRFYKCMFWALIISIIMIVVMVIVAYYYGNMAAVPQWLPAILSAIMGALGVWALMKTEPCKSFYPTGKCKE